MAISLKDLQKSVTTSPPRILIFGVAGCGKTTFCSQAPNPVFIQTEDGLGTIEATAFPLAKTLQDVMDALESVASEEHDYKTLVIDSLDWLEPLIQRKVCEDHNVPSIESIPYGKGFIMAMDYWREYLTAINYIRDNRNMMIMETAHSDIKRFDSPESDSYDRFVIKLHQRAAALVQEHSDCVFFANYKTHTTEEKTGFNQTRTRAIGGGQRVIYTQERPAFSSKNRYGLPETIPLNENAWEVLAANIPWFKQFQEPAKPEPKKAVAKPVEVVAEAANPALPKFLKKTTA